MMQNIITVIAELKNAPLTRLFCRRPRFQRHYNLIQGWAEARSKSSSELQFHIETEVSNLLLA